MQTSITPCARLHNITATQGITGVVFRARVMQAIHTLRQLQLCGRWSEECANPQPLTAAVLQVLGHVTHTRLARLGVRPLSKVTDHGPEAAPDAF